MTSLRNRVFAGVLVCGSLALTSCYKGHLGADAGKAYRKAIADQRESRDQHPSSLDAADARIVLMRHRSASPLDEKKRSRNRTKSSISLEQR